MGSERDKELERRSVTRRESMWWRMVGGFRWTVGKDGFV